MERDLISVIVPVYNVQEYLTNCINSILNQSYKNIEIILVDDGSTDESSSICDSYIKKDNRIKVIHKANGGLSDARNIGIKSAKGKYITFVDSDDYLDENYVKALYILITENNSDIACCRMKKTDSLNDKIINKNEKISIYNSIDAIKEILYQRNIDNSAPSKIFKKDLFENILFPVGYAFEDLDTMYKLFLQANKIVSTTNNYYLYYQRQGSILHTVKDKTINDLLTIIDNMNKNLINYGELKAPLMARTLNANFYIYNRSTNKDIKENSKKYIIENRKNVLKDSNISKKTKYGIIISLVSFKLVNLLDKMR